MNERIAEEKEYFEYMLWNNYADAKYKEFRAKLEEYKSLLEYLTGFMYRNNWIKAREYEDTLSGIGEWAEEVLENYDN